MEILGRALALALLAGGCYSPAVRDCTITCEAANDCGNGQVCGADHLCASPSIAGTCAQHPQDGGVDAPALHDAAAPPRDAPPLDAAMHVDMHVKIDGAGKVVVDNVGTCDTTAPSHGDCHYSVLLGASVTLHAIETTMKFDKWTGSCSGDSATCNVDATAALDIHARFVNN